MRAEFPEHVKEFLRTNAKGRMADELTQLINKELNTNYTVAQIVCAKKRYKIRSGAGPRNGGTNATSFKKGSKIGELTRFKKGDKPLTYKPVGSEYLDKAKGILMIKVAEPNKWITKNRFVWEQHNGPLPSGYMVITLDGDKTNSDISNLAIVTKGELLTLVNKELRFDNTELTKTGVLIAKVINKGYQRKKQKAKKHEKFASI